MSQIMESFKGIIKRGAFTVFITFIPTAKHSRDISLLLLLHHSTNEHDKTKLSIHLSDIGFKPQRHHSLNLIPDNFNLCV